MIVMSETEFLNLKLQIEKETIKKYQLEKPNYRNLANEEFRRNFRGMILPPSGYTPQFASLETKIRVLVHTIRSFKHIGYPSPYPPIATQEDFEEAIVIHKEICELVASHL